MVDILPPPPPPPPLTFSSRVKECSIDTVCHFCLGQEGPLSLGSACGKTSPFCVSSLPFIIKCALKCEERSSDSSLAQSWHWWLGRLNFIERIIQRFSWDFLLANCVYHPPFAPPSPDLEDSLTSMSLRSAGDLQPSSLEFPSEDEGEEGDNQDRPIRLGDDRDQSRKKDSPVTSSVTSGNHLLPPPPQFPARTLPTPSQSSPAPHPATESNLLAQAWYFAAKATHVPHNKVGKVARRVIIRIAKVLRSEEFFLEIVHDVISRCHRTQAEGLLDRVLIAREKPTNEITHQPHGEPKKKKAGVRQKGEDRSEKEGTSSQTYTPFPETVKRKTDVPTSVDEGGTQRKVRGVSPRDVDSAAERRRLSEYGSDDSYRSAVSDLSGEERGGDSEKRERKQEEERRAEGQSSSGGSSDSKSDKNSGGLSSILNRKLPV